MTSSPIIPLPTTRTVISLDNRARLTAWTATETGSVIAAFVAGIWICGESARRLQVHDHPAIVWDEIVGFLAVCLVVPADIFWFAAAFALFRLFDIVKPWPIRDLDHSLGGGIGIMLDDLVAAGYGAACLLLYQYFFP